ncbi:MAG TPA: hypothetical protein EYH01_06325, partial [Campylobacterales bacterium]|nr:hypothetical protein [Campylobacterales bacterium]
MKLRILKKLSNMKFYKFLLLSQFLKVKRMSMSKSFNEAREKFEAIFSATMSAEDAKDYLVSLYAKGETSEEIAAAVEVMRKYS